MFCILLPPILFIRGLKMKLKIKSMMFTLIEFRGGGGLVLTTMSHDYLSGGKYKELCSRVMHH